MNITITTKVSVPDDAKKYVEDKAPKFEKFSKLRKIDAIMDKDGEKYKLDISVALEHGGSDVVASATGADWLSVTDDVSDKIEKQLRRIKEKKKSHRIKKVQPKQSSEEEEQQQH